MAKHKILVVDDEESLCEILQFNLEVEGYEADDVIGTLSQKGVEAGYEVFMVTPDKDYGQLVRDNCKIYKQKGAEGSIEIVDREAIRGKYGIDDPSLVRDILALWGDASDNIPGVPGIGEKTAEKAKMEIANVFDPTGEKKMTIRGRNLLKGLPESIEISDQDIYDAIHENAMEIVEQVKLVLESTPPELVGDILSNGILLTGGGAMLGGLPELISDNVGAPCFVAENPIECVARGVDAAFKMSGELLDGFEQIQLYNFK